MRRTRIAPASVICAALVLTGCVSGTPRPYAPLLQPQPADQVAFESDFAACANAVAAGERQFQSSTGAVVAGTAVTVAAVDVLGGAAAATAVGGSTVLAATGVGLLLLVPVATYTMSSARRRRNEREIQNAMTECLAQRGHTVAGWERLSRAEAASVAAVTPTQRAAAAE